MKTKIENQSVEIKKINGKFYLTTIIEISPLEIEGIMNEINHREEVRKHHEEEARAGLL